VRENRTHGSEGGEDIVLPDPYLTENLADHRNPFSMMSRVKILRTEYHGIIVPVLAVRLNPKPVFKARQIESGFLHVNKGLLVYFADRSPTSIDAVRHRTL
jgi:hypothetical protein